MLVRLRTYLDLLQRATAHEASSAARAKEITRLTVELTDARKEIRRLTDIVVALKQQNYNVPPGYGDEAWGSYSMEEVEREQLEKRQPRPLPALSDEERLAEAELTRDLEAAIRSGEL